MSDAIFPVPGGNPGEDLPADTTANSESTSFKFAEPTETQPPPAAPEDRRRRRRALISAPVRVRGLDVTCGGPDEISTTIDVSRVGILFPTSQSAYMKGMDVMVTFPYTKAPTAIHAEQCGRVTRVFNMPDGRLAVAIALGALGIGEDLVDSGGRKLNQAAGGTQAVAQPSPKKPLVIAMDADPAIRESLKDYLTNEGYEVIAVNNHADARDVLNLFTPALVIAEIEGEGMPGYAICSHVKGTPRLQRVPVVLTTSSAYPSDYSSAHSLGAVVCMAKPYKQERLGHIVRLLAPLPQAKLQTAPPRPADPSRRPGASPRRKGARGNSSGPNGSILWRFRSSW
jgi:CheY-like chemotaxis protein